MRSNWVALFYMIPGNKRHGGGAYAVHLIRALTRMGYRPVVYQIAQRTDSAPQRFFEEIPYQRVSLGDACKIAETWKKSLILYAHYKHFSVETDALLAAGAGIVFHAVAEMKHTALIEACRASYKRPKVIAIRQRLADGLTAAGLDAAFVPHPYIQGPPKSLVRSMHAVSLARVDFVKHTEVIAEANKQLQPVQRVQIFGELNRMFAHHTLDAKFEGWRENYRGGFELGTGLALARQSCHVVDLTYCKNDGGGSQYTFLEAWEAEAQLIVHKRWTEVEGCVNDSTAVAIGSADELASALRRPVAADRISAGRQALAAHQPDQVIPQYAKALDWKYP